MDIKKLVGKRILIKEDSFSSSIVEVKVMELSANKKYIKLKHISGVEMWEEVKDYNEQGEYYKYDIIDVLKDKKEKKKKQL